MKVHTCADGNVVVAATGIIGKINQTVLLSYTPQGRLRWQCAVAAKVTEANTFVDFVEPQNAGSEYYGTLFVTGQTVVGEGKAELDTDWMTACVELNGGKIRWVRPLDGGTHGSDTVSTLLLDRFSGFYQGGTFSQSSAKIGHKAVLGLVHSNGEGELLWRHELPLPQNENVSYGGLSVNSTTNSTLISVIRAVPDKKIFSQLTLHNDSRAMLWQKTMEPPPGFLRLDAKHLSLKGGNDSSFVCGIIAKDNDLSYADCPQIWSAYLSGDGSILRQYAFFPSSGKGRALPNTIYHCHTEMLVVGQLVRSDGTADFLVLDYTSPKE